MPNKSDDSLRIPNSSEPSDGAVSTSHRFQVFGDCATKTRKNP